MITLEELDGRLHPSQLVDDASPHKESAFGVASKGYHSVQHVTLPEAEPGKKGERNNSKSTSKQSVLSLELAANRPKSGRSNDHNNPHR